MKSKIFFLLLTISVLSSCSIVDVLDCYDGQFIKKELKLNTFHKIDIDFPCEVILQKGNTQKIIIEGKEDMIRDLESKSSVSNDTWKARIRNNCVFQAKDVKFFITVPDLSEIKVDGNARIDTEQAMDNISSQLRCIVDGNASLFLDILQLEVLHLEIDGNAKADLRGKSKIMNIKIDGNATIHAHDMQVNSCDINIDGNATANVQVISSLQVKIDGNATVCYKGSPSITSNINGVGRLRNCN
jgi:hypothetical protein